MTDILERLRRVGYERKLCEEAADEIERLRETVRQRTKLLDDQLGTPCEQIRHEQEIERLREALKRIADENVDPDLRGNANVLAGIAWAALNIHKQIRVLVCGGRDYVDRDTAWAKLDMLNHLRGIACIIHGGANGADYIAGRWAETRKIPCEEYRADWDRYGKAAGFLRNAKMLEIGAPDLVVAFKGGRGTADMVRRAKTAGVPVEAVITTGDEAIGKK